MFSPVDRSEWPRLCEAYGMPIDQVAELHRGRDGTLRWRLGDGQVVQRLVGPLPDGEVTGVVSGRVNEAGGHDRAFIDGMRRAGGR